uniref:Uncharacterized protein n=1 Tax=Spongospora subterranea TaxID=70186 RepID=A0A0H5RJ36_9EUKA|eukprot:CRZ08714.1 hypothetical protein [Spongospora subterranea]
MCCAVAGLHPDWLSGNSDIGRYSPSFALGNGRILAIFISCGKHPVSMMLLGIPSIPPADLLLAFLTALSSSLVVIFAVGVFNRSFNNSARSSSCSIFSISVSVRSGAQ